jgi:hypothetical protein
LERARELDPFNPQHPAKLAELARSRGNLEETRAMARLALELDEERRLDALRQFLPGEKAALERLAETPGP